MQCTRVKQDDYKSEARDIDLFRILVRYSTRTAVFVNHVRLLFIAVYTYLADLCFIRGYILNLHWNIKKS